MAYSPDNVAPLLQRLIVGQLLISILITFAAGWFGDSLFASLTSALLGCCIAAVCSTVFFWRALSRDADSAESSLLQLYAAQFGKMACAAIGLGLAMKYIEGLNSLTLVAAFSAVWVSTTILQAIVVNKTD